MPSIGAGGGTGGQTLGTGLETVSRAHPNAWPDLQPGHLPVYFLGMPEASEKHLFQPSAISTVPDGPGVLELLSVGQTILIDWSEANVGATLREHFAGKHGTCTQIATHFRCEAHEDPEQHCKLLIAAHVKKHRSHPRCNRK